MSERGHSSPPGPKAPPWAISCRRGPWVRGYVSAAQGFPNDLKIQDDNAALTPLAKGAILGKLEGTDDWERVAKEAARTIPGREHGFALF